ncbi:protein mono-ADP-ribosyltransferase PARP6-like isoform X3 [Nerophis lumbriciformis]|uniref:protein mono-ADP-ribosyltransferase PARP6-like isoform X3 n=1 Tax=Nerophis lumbriciformis TaxID=546530 RepID=UPI002AE05DCF|nr:protein mono-ADP-ribosyltransferase PARP6-like isoform X3 [Nerophis lumbriciformis]
MDTECQEWSESEEGSNSEEEDTTYEESYAIEPCCHPRLDTDIETVRSLYSDSAISTSEYQSVDDVDVDLNIRANILDEEVAKAWSVDPIEPIIVRLHLSLSQYLDGPEPTVEVFQPSNRHHFNLGKKLQSVLASFISREWKHLTNDTMIVHQKRKHSWFRPGGTIKKFCAKLSIWLPLSKSKTLQSCSLRGRIVLPGMKLNDFTNHTTSYNIKNPSGELFTHTPSGKRVMVAGVKSSPHLSTKQLIELMFFSQAIRHCKTSLTLQHGFLVQVMKYAEQRILTLNEYCVVCDERHVFQNGPMLKRKSYVRLEKALDSLLLIRRMAQGPYSEIRKQMDRIDPLAVPLLQWILSSNRSYIVKLPANRVGLSSVVAQLPFMHTPHQFLLISSPPTKEARFQTARKLYGSTFAFHGSHIENWHSILRNGLVNASNTKFQMHGAAFGKGIYLSPISSISFGYSDMGKGQHQVPTKEELLGKYNRINKVQKDHPGRFLQSRNLNCVALCEVITTKDLKKHGNIWVCPIPDYVCTRFLFVYENGCVGDVHINTQDANIHSQILHVTATEPS